MQQVGGVQEQRTPDSAPLLMELLVSISAAPSSSRRRRRSVSLTTARWASSWRSAWASPWCAPRSSTPTWRTCCSSATAASRSRCPPPLASSSSPASSALSNWLPSLLQVTLSYGMFENKLNTIEFQGSFSKEDDPSRFVGATAIKALINDLLMLLLPGEKVAMATSPSTRFPLIYSAHARVCVLGFGRTLRTTLTFLHLRRCCYTNTQQPDNA